MIDDYWWLLIIFDDYWWLLIIFDDYWWFLVIFDDYWWLLMIIDDYWFLEGFIAKIWPVFWCGQKSPRFSHLSLVSSFLAHRSDIFTYLFWPYAFEFSAAHVFISLAVTAFSERSDGFTCAKTLGRGHSKVSDTEIEWEIVWNWHKYPLKLTVDICWYLTGKVRAPLQVSSVPWTSGLSKPKAMPI